MTSSPVRPEQSAGAIASLEQVWRWLAVTAGEDVDWRAYMNSPATASARSVIVVVWDARPRTCSRCGLGHRLPCPVQLGPDGGTVTAATARHDCGAELTAARHVTYQLADLASRSDVEAAVAAVELSSSGANLGPPGLREGSPSGDAPDIGSAHERRG